MIILAGYAGHGRSNLPGGLFSSHRDRSIGQFSLEIGMFPIMPHMVLDAYDHFGLCHTCPLVRNDSPDLFQSI